MQNLLPSPLLPQRIRSRGNQHSIESCGSNGCRLRL